MQKKEKSMLKCKDKCSWIHRKRKLLLKSKKFKLSQKWLKKKIQIKI